MQKWSPKLRIYPEMEPKMALFQPYFWYLSPKWSPKCHHSIDCRVKLYINQRYTPLMVLIFVNLTRLGTYNRDFSCNRIENGRLSTFCAQNYAPHNVGHYVWYIVWHTQCEAHMCTTMCSTHWFTHDCTRLCDSHILCDTHKHLLKVLCDALRYTLTLSQREL